MEKNLQFYDLRSFFLSRLNSVMNLIRWNWLDNRTLPRLLIFLFFFFCSGLSSADLSVIWTFFRYFFLMFHFTSISHEGLPTKTKANIISTSSWWASNWVENILNNIISNFFVTEVMHKETKVDSFLSRRFAISFG